MPLRSRRKSRSEVPRQSWLGSARSRNGEVGLTAIISQFAAAAPLCPALSFLTLVEKQNSNNRMTLKFVEDLYLGTHECGFA
jgi:hypothetical protein